MNIPIKNKTIGILFILLINFFLITDSVAIEIVPKPPFLDASDKYYNDIVIFKPIYVTPESEAPEQGPPDDLRTLPLPLPEVKPKNLIQEISNIEENSRAINLYNINTRESLNIVFWEKGVYIETALVKINKFLRDRRTGEIIKIDPELIMLAANLAKKVKYDGPITIVSAYRSEKTNDAMKSLGKRVASKSMHSTGKAVDISMKNIPLKTIHDAALGFGVGGVGYYPSDGFVHIDTGSPRVW